MRGFLTSAAGEIMSADVVILPGIGAFGDAMKALGQLDLVEPLREVAASGKPLFGICLGLQLLMRRAVSSVSTKGWASFEETWLPSTDRGVRPTLEGASGWLEPNLPALPQKASPLRTFGKTLRCRVWQMASSCTSFTPFTLGPKTQAWCCPPPRYGDVEFCSSLKAGNIFACQFHPERSGPEGLRIYRNVASSVKVAREKRNG